MRQGKNERPEDDEDYDQQQEGREAYFVMERPIEELPTFQSHIYRLYSPIAIQERMVNDDISHRMYFGKCKSCEEQHYLGTLVMRCHEAVQLYARIK